MFNMVNSFKQMRIIYFNRFVQHCMSLEKEKPDSTEHEVYEAAYDKLLKEGVMLRTVEDIQKVTYLYVPISNLLDVAIHHCNMANFVLLYREYFLAG